MKILITGGGGFVGEHLVAELVARGHEPAVVGVANGSFLKKYNIPVHEADLLDFDNLCAVMSLESPDAVVHLAAQSNVPFSWENPVLTASVNINGTINVLLAVERAVPQAKILNVGSSDEYGIIAKCGQPLTEDMECQPQNPYSISKLCAEQMILKLAEKKHLNVLHVRPFNHFGPGQRKGFVVSDFASQIAEIESLKIPPVMIVGDLTAARDFLYVNDVVRAYAMILEADIANGVYNIASGIQVRISEILEKLLSFSKTKIEIQQDENKMRPSDVPIFVGSSLKLFSTTGWKPKYQVDDALLATLDYWRMCQ